MKSLLFVLYYYYYCTRYLILFFYLSCPLHFSGVHGNSSEFIDISSLSTSFEKRIVRGVFIQSGFADSTGEDKLGPCPLGTYVDSSHTHPKCKNCSAGKL